MQKRTPSRRGASRTPGRPSTTPARDARSKKTCPLPTLRSPAAQPGRPGAEGGGGTPRPKGGSAGKKPPALPPKPETSIRALAEPSRPPSEAKGQGAGFLAKVRRVTRASVADGRPYA